ncbi:hypothetical protein H6G72_01065 [Planktothricoides sp. FACHB-1370]|uniref:Uncharacterized protein n=1 Tax=Planktothricoides raciborskii FACHB-1370 TaxID=2949576 RepID=A0ABR8E7J0_9CYAN|nr:hypothetical protein [Planktothricoides raciborskii FACHB-1370]MBD2585805.1 hypothetical protein [Planktothricoides raciborskii FACHB-1261]
MDITGADFYQTSGTMPERSPQPPLKTSLGFSFFVFLCVFVVKKYCLVRYGAELKLIISCKNNSSAKTHPTARNRLESR